MCNIFRIWSNGSQSVKESNCLLDCLLGVNTAFRFLTLLAIRNEKTGVTGNRSYPTLATIISSL